MGGLENNEHGTIPFVDKRIIILRTSWVVAGKSDEGVSIDVNRLHVICPVRLKRLQFDEMYPCQFEDTEPWHRQLLSPGTWWTWRHFICRWLILLSRYFHHDGLLREIFFFVYHEELEVCSSLVISGTPQTAVHSTGRLQSQYDMNHPND